MRQDTDNSAEALLKRSEQLQAQAAEIVSRLRVRELWEQIGRLYLVGSSRFGLMTAGNIDFEVYVERPDARAGFSVMAEIAAAPGVTGIRYHNFMGTPDPGLYWRIDYRDEGGALWDFDIWLVPFDHPHAGMADAFATALQHVLTRDARCAILALKAALAARPGAEHVRGIDIYRAALEGGVRNVAEFTRWQAEHPPAPIETWTPAR